MTNNWGKKLGININGRGNEHSKFSSLTTIVQISL